MLYIILLIAAGAVVAVDQIVKALVSASIPLGGEVPLIPGIVHLTCLHNSGAAFSILSGARWFFLVITFVFLAGLIYAVAKKKITGAYLWIAAMIAGGAIGNLIDRMLNGYVVDMFELEFMNFAVFNVADIFITCGAASMMLYALFFDRDEKKPEESSDDHKV